jgi:hypothetical protein
VIDRGERQIHRRRLPALIGLQVPLEVPRGMIATLRIHDR